MNEIPTGAPQAQNSPRTKELPPGSPFADLIEKMHRESDALAAELLADIKRYEDDPNYREWVDAQDVAAC